MKRHRYSETKILSILKEHEAGGSAKEMARRHGVAENTVYRWKAQFGGMEVSEARRLREVEVENLKLKRLLAEAELDKAALKELVEGMYGPPRDCNNPILGVAKQVCINVSGLFVGGSGPGHEGTAFSFPSRPKVRSRGRTAIRDLASQARKRL